jgi:hypothetical protein
MIVDVIKFKQMTLNWKNDQILIKDNFFSEEILSKVHIELPSLNFTNRHVDRKDRTSYNKIYFNFPLSSDHYLVEETTNILLKEYNIKYKKMESVYFLSTKNNLPTPHTDTCELNVLIYLKGDSLMHNGTGIYEQNNLNTHLGFKENRAILFNGAKYMHASLQSFEQEASPRYVMANFLNYYDK